MTDADTIATLRAQLDSTLKDRALISMATILNASLSGELVPTREAAEAHLRGDKPIKLDPAGEVIMAALGIIKDAKPVTWPDGVAKIVLDCEVSVEIDGMEIMLDLANGRYNTTTARQLAALIVAAADFIERNAE